MAQISFVIPVFKETQNILPLLDAIESAMANTVETHEIMFADDGSPDDTWEVINRAACGRDRCVRSDLSNSQHGPAGSPNTKGSLALAAEETMYYHRA
jgi:glycosyltransferase involved in cell wall biosynthesis